jgi:hypothetical protein
LLAFLALKLVDDGMLKGLILVFTFLISACATAAQKPVCWQQEVEIIPNTKYTSEEKYDSDLYSWEHEQPSTPNIFALFSAYQVYKKERPTALKMQDKVAHCYIGCRISEEVNVKSAVFAAWKKELDDLTDCNPRTRFEVLDFEATVDGAHQAHECESYCHKTYEQPHPQ